MRRVDNAAALGGVIIRSLAMRHVCLVALVMLASSIEAFVPRTLHSGYPPDAAGRVMKWDLSTFADGAIPYWINPTIPAGFTPLEPTNSADVIVAKVHEAFRAWENVSTSTVKFRFAGFTDAGDAGDGRMVVSFSTAPAHGGPIDTGCRAAAQSSPATGPAGVILTRSFVGQILECDPTIHPLPLPPANRDIQVAWWVGDVPPPSPAPGGRQGRVDLQGILTHEIGHVLGLDHTGTAETATMTIWNDAGETLGGLSLRTLSADDEIGVSTLYPEKEFLRSRGTISGRVVREQNGSPVFGAHVVAMDADSGVIVAATITGLSDVGADGIPARFQQRSGQYRLAGLPPGTYRIYAEPFDGPNTNSIGGIFGVSASQQAAEKDFSPAFFDGQVTVAAAEHAANVDLRVAARHQEAPNLDLQAWISEGGSRTDPVLARQGSNIVMELAAGENIVTDQGLAAETRFSFIGSGVTITRTDGRRTIALRLSIAPDAAIGPRLLQVTTANGTAFLSGALTVVPAS